MNNEGKIEVAIISAVLVTILAAAVGIFVEHNADREGYLRATIEQCTRSMNEPLRVGDEVLCIGRNVIVWRR